MRDQDFWENQEARLAEIHQEIAEARAELEAVRIDAEIDRVMAEAKVVSADARAKIALVDDLRARGQLAELLKQSNVDIDFEALERHNA